MTLIGVDANATQMLGIAGPEGSAQPLMLGGSQPGLAMALSLQERRPQIGEAGRSLCRQYPHLVCQDFLSALGSDRTWSAGRHRLDARNACGLFLDRVRAEIAGAGSVVLSVPAYLSAAQVELLTDTAQHARLPIQASVGSPLALTLAARQRPSAGSAITAEIDDHALSLTLLDCTDRDIQVSGRRSIPTLGLRLWKEAILNGMAELCVRHSRRDPRDSGAAEQLLYDQLDSVLQTSRNNCLVEVIVQASQWCQNLIIHPQQLASWCSSLVEQLRNEWADVVATVGDGGLRTVLTTETVAMLPGVEELLREDSPAGAQVLTSHPDAAARGAHSLAAACQRGEIPVGHHGAGLALPGAHRRSPAPSFFRSINP